MIIESIIAAFVPALIESGKQFIQSKIGGVRATTVDEQIKLDQNEVAKLEALAKLDNPGGTPSQWVIDLRGSARYLGALAVVCSGIVVLFVAGIPEPIQQLGIEAANIAFGFLFGSRIVSNFGKK